MSLENPCPEAFSHPARQQVGNSMTGPYSSFRGHARFASIELLLSNHKSLRSRLDAVCKLPGKNACDRDSVLITIQPAAESLQTT